MTQIIQQVFSIHIQLNQNIPMPREDNNALENFVPHKDKKSILEKQDIKKDYRDLIGKSSDTRSHARDDLSRCTPQNRFLANELLSSLRKIKFNEQEFSIGKFVSDIKYHYLDSQNNNSFYSFNDQLDYALANYFAKSKTTKGNVDRFLSNILITPFIAKLSY